MIITRTTDHCPLKKGTKTKREKYTQQSILSLWEKTNHSMHRSLIHEQEASVYKYVFRKGLEKTEWTSIRDAQWNYQREWPQDQTWGALITYWDFLFFFPPPRAWSNSGTESQRSFTVTVLGDTQKPIGQGPEQPSQTGPILCRGWNRWLPEVLSKLNYLSDSTKKKNTWNFTKALGDLPTLCL